MLYIRYYNGEKTICKNQEVFDDGRDKFKSYTNKWIVMDKKFNGGKLVLKNAKHEKGDYK